MTAPEPTPAIERAWLAISPSKRPEALRDVRYALTAALNVEEMARVLGESAKRHGDDPDDETGRWTYTFDSRELHCRCGALIARAGDNLLPTQAWTHHLHESQAEALRAAIVGGAS